MVACTLACTAEADPFSRAVYVYKFACTLRRQRSNRTGREVHNAQSNKSLTYVSHSMLCCARLPGLACGTARHRSLCRKSVACLDLLQWMRLSKLYVLKKPARRFLSLIRFPLISTGRHKQVRWERSAALSAQTMGSCSLAAAVK